MAVEADFYGLDEVLLAIKRPPLDLDEHLPKEILNIQKEERKLRSKFVGGNGGANSLAPYIGLISLFAADKGCNYDGFEGIPIECPLLFDAKHPLRQDRSCLYLSMIGSHNFGRAKEEQPVTVKTLEQFVTNFNKQHPNILQRIQDILRKENVVIAGGSVLRALTGDCSVRSGSFWNSKSDIDLFFYGMSSKQEANELVRRLFLALAVDNETWVILRCHGVINIHNEDTKIQIILRLYDNPTEVLIGFDVDCCGCCYTGSDVKITKRCLSALVSGVNVLNPLHAWPRKASYELRLGKYAVRGFAVYVPGLPKNRIGYCEEIQKRDLKSLTGIARFFKVDIEINTSYKRQTIESFGRTLLVFPDPRNITSLRQSVIDDMTPSELLLNGLSDVYDEDDNLADINDVLVPAVYGDSDDLPSASPRPWQWHFHAFDESILTRDNAIQNILDCSSQDNVPNCIPRKLEDAWRLEKRSREYSNDDMEKADVDMLYYSPVYDYCDVNTTNDEIIKRW